MSDFSDDALDTAATFLRALADHGMDASPELREQTLAWMRHITVGGPHPQQAEIARDWKGVQRFVKTTMRDAHAVHIKTTTQFRDTVWGLASELHEMVKNDDADAGALEEGLESLRAAVESGSVDTLQRAATVVSRRMLVMLDAREQRRKKAVLEAANRLPHMVDALRLADAGRADPVTGFMESKAFFDVAERVLSIANIAEVPVSLVTLEVRVENATKRDLDAVLERSAPTVDKAFLCPTDIVGRVGRSTFAVVCVPCELVVARRSAERAVVALARIDVQAVGQVKALTSPVSHCFSEIP